MIVANSYGVLCPKLVKLESDALNRPHSSNVGLDWGLTPLLVLTFMRDRRRVFSVHVMGMRMKV